MEETPDITQKELRREWAEKVLVFGDGTIVSLGFLKNA